MADDPFFRRDEEGNPYRYMPSAKAWVAIEQTNPVEAAFLGLGSFGDQAATAIKQMTGTAAPGEFERMQEDRALFEQTAGADQYLATALGQHAPAAIVGAMTGGVAAPLIAGAAEGALQPAATGEDRLTNVLLGTATTGAGLGVGRIAGKIIAGIDAANPSMMTRMVSGAGRGVDDVTPALAADSADALALANRAEQQGFRMTAGQKTGDPYLMKLDQGGIKKPELAGFYGGIKEHNEGVLSSSLAKAMGATDDEIAANGGKITPSLFSEVRERTNNFFDYLSEKVPEVKLTSDVSSALQGNTVIKKLQNLNPNRFAKLSDDVLSGREYQSARRALVDYADKEGGEVARETSELISKLDDQVGKSIPKDAGGKGLLDDFAANRERFSMQELATSGKVMPEGGGINPVTLANKLKSKIGNSRWVSGDYKYVSPAVADLAEKTKTITHKNMLPFHTSNTPEGLEAIKLYDAVADMLRLDPRASFNLVKQQTAAKAFAKLSESNPAALKALLTQNPKNAQALGAILGIEAGGAGAGGFE